MRSSMGGGVMSFKEDDIKTALKGLLLGFALFSFTAFLIISLWKNNVQLLLVLLAECIAILWIWHDRFDISFFSVLSVVGTIAEIAFVSSGVWSYTNPTFLGIPLWFPVSFGTAGLLGGRIARSLSTLLECRI
jgi:uncharacterized membrane protein YoaT (DUF817 family)